MQVYRLDEMQDEELMEELVQPALRAMGRIDAGATPFLARSLEQFLSREYEVPLEELPIVNGAVMDFRDDVDPWAKTFTSTIVDGSGVAEFYDSYSQSGMPMASISSEEFTRRVHTAALGYEFSVEDIGFEGLASRNRQPVRLRDRLRRHSVRGMLELAERTFMWGDASRDVYGFATHPNVTEVARSGPAWTIASGEEIIQDITNMYQAVRDNTCCTREPNAQMVPERVWDELESAIYDHERADGRDEHVDPPGGARGVSNHHIWVALPTAGGQVLWQPERGPNGDVPPRSRNARRRLPNAPAIPRAAGRRAHAQGPGVQSTWWCGLG